jgi:hypothetical protein
VFLIGVFAAVAAFCGALIPRLYRAGTGQLARRRRGKPTPGSE